MRCPFCEAMDTKVIDSRGTKDGFVIRRRRSCEGCKNRFTTYEKIENQLPMVIKKDENREGFNRDKIIRGLKQACQKRPVSMEKIEEVTDDLEHHLMDRPEKEVDSHYIGEWVLQRLQSLDQVAYVRFASVYRDFRNAEEFMEELRNLLKSGDKKSGI